MSTARSKPPARPRKAAAAQLRFRMRVSTDDGVAIGPGKVDLLEAIRDHGSISAAAREMGMSYRRAWLLLDEMNRLLKAPAAVTQQGGERGGGSVLTPVGESVVRLYRAIEARAHDAATADIAALLRLLAKR